MIIRRCGLTFDVLGEAKPEAVLWRESSGRGLNGGSEARRCRLGMVKAQ